MKTADEMLNDIGYVKYLDNEETIIYKYEGETFKVSLTFDKREFKKIFHATEAMWVANNEGWYTQEFKNKWDKYCASQGYWSSIWHGYFNEEIVEFARILEHILFAYKRVLKENEILKEEKEQAWEEWNNLEQGSYETEQKLKQQIKESQRENEELKERIREHTLLISPYYVKENYIPIQKIKDKIEEEKLPLIIVGGKRNKKTLEYGIQLGRRQILQELLESEE